MLTHDVNNLGEATTAIMQPVPRDGLETALHILPNMAANVLAIYEPAHGSLTGVAALTNFANPMEFICSAIQAGSRLGYQDSAELCAQYLAPVLDAIKFNYFPYGVNLFSTADTLPKNVAYSEPRLQPPPGYQGHHGPRHLLTGYTVVAPQFGAGMDRRAGHAGSTGPAGHGEPVDAGIVGRVDGRAEHHCATGGAATWPARQTPTTRTIRCRHRGTRSPCRRHRRPRRLLVFRSAQQRRPHRQDAGRADGDVRLVRRVVWQALALLMAAVVLTSCGNWRGIANVPLPGGPGSGAGSYTSLRANAKHDGAERK